jgi:hypothetical protein
MVVVSIHAAVPRGSEVLVVVATHARDSNRRDLVLDRTTGTLWVDDAFFELTADSRILLDPARVLESAGWTVLGTHVGRVVACVVASRDWNDTNVAKTRLYIEPLPTAYR